MNLKHQKLTEKILEAFYEVYNTLGYGFLEKVYENALYFELQKFGFNVKKQENIKVYYKNKLVGDYYADLIVENKVILELKAANKIIKAHELQMTNYLRASNIELGLLLNFGEKPEFKRKIFSNM